MKCEVWGVLCDWDRVEAKLLKEGWFEDKEVVFSPIGIPTN